MQLATHFTGGPLQDVSVQVGIDIPSIKATLSDSEYRFITLVAGSNFGEPLRLPAAAQWLEDALTDEPMKDAESEPTPSMQVRHTSIQAYGRVNTTWPCGFLVHAFLTVRHLVHVIMEDSGPEGCMIASHAHV